MKFKDKLKQLRIERQISQQKLADDLFVSRSMIAKYETGACLPTLEMVENIANYFHIETFALLDCQNEIGIPYKLLRIFMIFHTILFWLEISIYLIFIVFSVIPFFNNQNLIIGGQRNNSIIVVFTLVYSSISVIAFIIWKFVFKSFRNKMIMLIFSDFNFLIEIFLIFVAVVVGIGGTQSP